MANARKPTPQRCPGHPWISVLPLELLLISLQACVAVTLSDPVTKYQFSIYEEVPTGSLVTADIISDVTSRHGYSNDVTRSLSLSLVERGDERKGEGEGLFAVEGGSKLVVGRRVDREVICPRTRSGLGSRSGSGQDCQVGFDLTVLPSQYFEVIHVEITILDINDHTPFFSSPSLPSSFSHNPSHLLLHILESASPGTLLTLPGATDLDGDPVNRITEYRLSSSPQGHPFRLLVTSDGEGRERSGERVEGVGEVGMEMEGDLRLELVGVVDRETVDRYQLNVTALDGGSPQKSAVLIIDIYVDDVNDNSPRFERDSYNVTLYTYPPSSLSPHSPAAPPSAPLPPGSQDSLNTVSQVALRAGSLVAQIRAVDPDSGLNGQIRYRLSKKSDTLSDHLFHISVMTGDVTLARDVVTSDNGGQGERGGKGKGGGEGGGVEGGEQRIRTYSLVVIATDLGENSLPSSVLLTVDVIDTRKKEEEGEMEGGQIQKGEMGSEGEEDGAEGTPRQSGPLVIIVETVEGNNHTAHVLENNPPGSFLAHVTVLFDQHVTDDDGVTCSLAKSSDESGETLDSEEAGLAGKSGEALDGEEMGLFDLVPLYGHRDYKLIALRSLDRERKHKHHLTIVCSLRLPAPALHTSLSSQTLPPSDVTESSVNVKIVVVDVDDNPTVFERPVYKVAVRENNIRGANIGRVEASDLDHEKSYEGLGEGGLEGRVGEVTWGVRKELVYELDSDADDWFRIDSRTGDLYALVSFDREFVDHFTFHVLAFSRPLTSPPSSSPPLSSPYSANSYGRGAVSGVRGLIEEEARAGVARCLVHVTVTDEDDEEPRFLKSWYKFEISENLNSGTSVGSVSAMDDDLHPYNLFLFHLDHDLDLPLHPSSSPPSHLPPLQRTGSQHFALDPVTGIIYTRRTLDREVLSHYTLRILVVPIPPSPPSPPSAHPANSSTIKTGGTRRNRDVIKGSQSQHSSTSRSQSVISSQGSSQSQHSSAGGDVAVVFITVKDVNDNAPLFLFPSPDGSSVLRMRRREGEGEGSVAVSSPGVGWGEEKVVIVAGDRDEGRNAIMSYSISGGNEHTLFSVEPRTGELFWSDKLGRTIFTPDRICQSKLTFTARDHGAWPPGPMASIVELLVIIDDCDWSVVLVDNESDDLIGADSRAIGETFQFRLLIVVSVLAGCVVIAVVMTATVGVLRHRDAAIARHVAPPDWRTKGEEEGERESCAGETDERFDEKKEGGGGNGGGVGGSTFLMLDNGVGSEGEGIRGVLLYVKGQEEPVGRFHVRFTTNCRTEEEEDDEDENNKMRCLKDSSLESNSFISRVDRDSDSGYLDVSSTDV